MKICYVLLLSAALTGCSSMGGKSPTASASHPAKMASATPTNEYHTRVVSEFSDGETKFLEMAPDSDSN